MRPYKNNENVQAKAYYSNRFRVAPHIPEENVENDEVFNEIYTKLKNKVDVINAYIQAGQLVVWITPKTIVKALKVLKELSFDFLSELSAVDFISQKGGFEVFYQLLSMKNRKRMRVKFFLPQKDSIESVSHIFKSANWSEREMYDMFGIKILNHPRMKRILMPDDWYGHPLLKTYPLHGDEAAQWYEIDHIFGKDFRDIVGPEQRDSAMVDERDTRHFARIRHEVAFGAEPSKEPTNYGDYQEDEGVFLVSKMKKEKSKILKERP